jgi:hypothetical protein
VLRALAEAARDRIQRVAGWRNKQGGLYLGNRVARM